MKTLLLATLLLTASVPAFAGTAPFQFSAHDMKITHDSLLAEQRQKDIDARDNRQNAAATRRWLRTHKHGRVRQLWGTLFVEVK